MTRALVTALIVLILASVSALSLFGDDSPAPQLGHAPPTHAVGFEPVDNVPTMAPGTATTVARVHAASAKRTVHGEVPDFIRASFARFGPDIAEQAVRVAGCETGWTFDPGATNGSHRGLFQISVRWHAERIARLGYTLDDMWDAAANVVVAIDLFMEQGWGPWECRPT